MAPLQNMQQIAILIITFSVYVSSIRNEPHVRGSSSTGKSDSFRPSQLIEFTTADASTPQNHPPTYVETNSAALVTLKQLQEASGNRRYVAVPDRQFSFPSEISEKQQQFQHHQLQMHQEDHQKMSAVQNSDITNGNNNYKYNNNINSYNDANKMSSQLQTTPVLIYRDPYTNKNYQNHPTLSNQYSQQYTVHSTVMVGADGGFGDSYTTPQHYQREPSATTITSNGEYQRPGLVLDEDLQSSYERPVYASSNKFTTTSHQEHPNVIPSGVALSPSRQRKEEYLSYDSHDYPPPSYYQQPLTTTRPMYLSSSAFPSSRPLSSPSSPTSTSSLLPSSSSSSSSANYANNFGNYLQGVQYARPSADLSASHYANGNFNGGPFQYQRPTHPRPPPSNNNYYGYQLGEIPPRRPPSASAQLSSGRPPYAPPLSNYLPPAQQAVSGLATLASFLTGGTQLLGGNVNGNGNSNGLAGFTSGHGIGSNLLSSRPLNMQLIKALENIARNDDLQCVPKVLCQMIAGQTQRGQLPSFITSPAITNFLAAFPAASPALIYGRAALLGISGGDTSCARTYAQCPKNEYEILHYLNNHRGGFFKFFSEPEEHTTHPHKYPQQQQQQGTNTDNGSDGSNTSLFSILSALASGNSPSVTTTTPRPVQRPTLANFDITNGIGNFFSNVLSEYLGGTEYQRRRKKRSLPLLNTENVEVFSNGTVNSKEEPDISNILEDENFYDEQDDEDTQSHIDSNIENEKQNGDIGPQYDDVQGRILHKAPDSVQDQLNFFSIQTSHTTTAITEFNRQTALRKLKFPNEENSQPDVAEVIKETDNDYRPGKMIHFKDDMGYSSFEVPHVAGGLHINLVGSDLITKAQQHRQHKQIVFQGDDNNKLATTGERIIFPDHINERIRTGRILNRPAYTFDYTDYLRTQQLEDKDKFVVSDDRRRQPHSHRHRQQTNYGQSTNFAGNNRLSQLHQSTNKRLPLTAVKQPDDENVYITNGQGVTEYFITPDGRKVYL